MDQHRTKVKTTCHVCSKRISTRKLEGHLKRHETNPGEVLRDKSVQEMEEVDHISVIRMKPEFKSSSPRRYRCVVCGKRYLTTDALELHSVIRHSENGVMIKPSRGLTDHTVNPISTLPKIPSTATIAVSGNLSPSTETQTCSPCGLKFQDTESLTSHMGDHIYNNCQGSQVEVRDMSNEQCDILNLLDNHLVRGHPQLSEDLICQEIRWQAEDVRHLLELNLQDLVLLMVDYYCSSCNCWFLCPLSLRRHVLTCIITLD